MRKLPYLITTGLLLAALGCGGKGRQKGEFIGRYETETSLCYLFHDKDEQTGTKTSDIVCVEKRNGMDVTSFAFAGELAAVAYSGPNGKTQVHLIGPADYYDVMKAVEEKTGRVYRSENDVFTRDGTEAKQERQAFQDVILRTILPQNLVTNGQGSKKVKNPMPALRSGTYETKEKDNFCLFLYSPEKDACVICTEKRGKLEVVKGSVAGELLGVQYKFPEGKSRTFLIMSDGYYANADKLSEAGFPITNDIIERGSIHGKQEIQSYQDTILRTIRPENLVEGVPEAKK